MHHSLVFTLALSLFLASSSTHAAVCFTENFETGYTHAQTFSSIDFGSGYVLTLGTTVSSLGVASGNWIIGEKGEATADNQAPGHLTSANNCLTGACGSVIGQFMAGDPYNGAANQGRDAYHVSASWPMLNATYNVLDLDSSHSATLNAYANSDFTGAVRDSGTLSGTGTDLADTVLFESTETFQSFSMVSTEAFIGFDNLVVCFATTELEPEDSECYTADFETGYTNMDQFSTLAFGPYTATIGNVLNTGAVSGALTAIGTGTATYNAASNGNCDGTSPCNKYVGNFFATDADDVVDDNDHIYMTFNGAATMTYVSLQVLDLDVGTTMAGTGYTNPDFSTSAVSKSVPGTGNAQADFFWVREPAGFNSFSFARTAGGDAWTGLDNLRVCFAQPEENPLTCEVDGDNDRIFYRGSLAATCQTTPTTANSCYYSTQHLDVQNPVRMRTTADGDVTDVTRIENDKLHLAFDLPTKYYDAELRFPDQDGTDCNGWTLDKTVVHDASGQYDNGCYTTYVYTRDWTNAYNSVDPICGFTRDDTDASFIELELNWGVHAWEDLENVRDTAVRRNQTWLMPLIVRFPKQVTATTTSIEAFSPVNLIPLLTAQSVVIDESGPTVTLTVDLLTEVQDPFRLESITMDSIPADTTLVTDLTNDTPARVDAECTNSNANCANTWRLSFTSQDTEAPCNFNGAYTFSFTITCSNDLTNCPVDSSTNSATVVFNLATSDHCPTVIADVDLAASMQIFQEATHENLKDDFLDTQVAYFLADVSSTQVALDETEFYSITLDRPVSADVALLDKAQTGTLDFAAGVDNQGDYNLRHDVGGAANAGASSHPTFHFTILTDASHLNLGNDDSEVITVRAVIDVRYPNLSKRVSMTTLNQASQQHSASASMNAGVTSNSGNGASTASSSSTMFGMNVMVVYAGAAVVALVAVAAIVVSMRRGGSNRSQMEKMESTAELTTTTSAV